MHNHRNRYICMLIDVTMLTAIIQVIYYTSLSDDIKDKNNVVLDTIIMIYGECVRLFDYRFYRLFLRSLFHGERVGMVEP